jgi:NAD(P)-dependent dehydrogenase (short-subunit alcohol dehydrogenase family)
MKCSGCASCRHNKTTEIFAVEIKGKRIFISGGAVRIGRAIVKAVAERGAKILFSYNKSINEAKSLSDEINASFPECECRAVRMDFRATIPENIFASFGKCDVMINNASIYLPDKIINETQSQIEEQMKINFFAPLFLSRLFAEQKIKKGCIINILDCRIADLDADGGSYWLSKKCLGSLTELLAAQLAPRIRVNGVAPGAVLPPLGSSKSFAGAAASSAPLKRTPNLEELIDAIFFLIRNDSITGQIIYADCGRFISRQMKQY